MIGISSAGTRRPDLADRLAPVSTYYRRLQSPLPDSVRGYQRVAEAKADVANHKTTMRGLFGRASCQGAFVSAAGALSFGPAALTQPLIPPFSFESSVSGYDR